MTPIATIRNSDPHRERVTLYAGDNGHVWAAAPDERPYDTLIAVADVRKAWPPGAGPGDWDYQPIEDAR